jgi:hypothetical protein
MVEIPPDQARAKVEMIRAALKSNAQIARFVSNPDAGSDDGFPSRVCKQALPCSSRTRSISRSRVSRLSLSPKNLHRLVGTGSQYQKVDSMRGLFASLKFLCFIMSLTLVGSTVALLASDKPTNAADADAKRNTRERPFPETFPKACDRWTPESYGRWPRQLVCSHAEL